MNLKLLSSILIIQALSEGISFIVVPLYSVSLGADRMLVGLIVSVYAIAFTGASLLWGKASDIFGRKLVLGTGMLGGSIIYFSCTFVSDPKLLVGMHACLGFVDASFWIVPTALIADLAAPQKMGEAVGKITMFQGIGLIGGPLLGGFLIEQLNYHSVFYICAAFAFSASLLVFFWLQKKPKVLTTAVKSSSKIPARAKFGATAKKNLTIAYIFSIFTGMLYGVIESQFIVHASEILGKEYLVGFLITSYCITETFIQPPAGRLSDSIGRYRTILLAFIISAIGFLTLIFLSSFGFLLIAVAVIGLGIGTLSVVSTAILMDVAPPSQRGLISGFDHVSWGAGYFLGPMLGGVATIYSVGAPYMMCITISAIGGTLSLIAYTRAFTKKSRGKDA